MKLRTITLNGNLYTRSLDLLKLIDSEVDQADDALNSGALSKIEYNILYSTLKHIRTKIITGALRYDRKHNSLCTQKQLIDRTAPDDDVPEIFPEDFPDSVLDDSDEYTKSPAQSEAWTARLSKEPKEKLTTDPKDVLKEAVKKAPEKYGIPGRYAIGEVAVGGHWLLYGGNVGGRPYLTQCLDKVKLFCTYRDAAAARDFLEHPENWQVLDMIDYIPQEHVQKRERLPKDLGLDEGNENAVKLPSFPY